LITTLLSRAVFASSLLQVETRHMATKVHEFRIRMAVAALAIALLCAMPGFAHAGAQEVGDQPGATPLADTTGFSLPGIYPSTIYPSAGRWTFLVTGIPTGTITDVTLRLNGSTTPPVSHEAVDETSSLWDFDYPQLGEAATADVLVMTERDTLVTSLTVVATRTPSHGQVPRGELSIRLKPHVFAWTAGQDSKDLRSADRPLASVPCADKRLAELMSFYGVYQVSKLIPQMSDADSLFGTRRQIVFPLRIRSVYELRFPTTHSVFSFMELLKLCDSVLDSSWLPLVDGLGRMPSGRPGVGSPK
jgi:hypothetical protein